MTRRRFPLVPTLVLGGACGLLNADTVYLKNGNWIDGIVRSRSEKAVEIEIGSIGKVEVPAEEIHLVEKNNRTGAEKAPQEQSQERKLDLKIVTKDGKKIVTSQAEPARPEEGNAGAKDAPPSPANDAAVSKSVDEDPSARKLDEGEESVSPTSRKKEEKQIAPELRTRIEGLIQDLQRQKAQIRTRAERHLRAIGPAALPFLVKIARNEADLTRTAVFRLFAELGDETVIEVCINALLDGNEYVRDFANRTLERVTNERFGYLASASPKRREAGYEKWRRWWEQEKQALAEAAKLGQKN